MHPLALEDAANGRQRPKIERYDDMLFLALRTLAYVESDERDEGGDVVETGSVMVFVAEHAVITIRHGRHALDDAGCAAAWSPRPSSSRSGPSSVLHAVADKVVDDYLVVVDAVNEDIEEIETSVFGTRAKTDIERIYQLKRDVIEMKRTVGPLGRPPARARPSARAGWYHPEIRGVLPRRRGPPLPGARPGASFDELLSSHPAGGARPADRVRERGHAQDLGLGGHRRRPDDDRRDRGDELRAHAGAADHRGYPAVLGTMVTVCAILYRLRSSELAWL